MNDQIWPPPPTIPDPTAEYEDFLTACVLNPKSKPPISRFALVREIRRGKGLNPRRCVAVVNSYCERHGVFPTSLWARLLLTLLPGLGVFVLLFIVATLGRHLPLIIGCLAIIGTFALQVCGECVVNKKARREGEDARGKAATWQ